MDLRPLLRPATTGGSTPRSSSFIGSMVTYVALPYQVYRVTGSSFAVGLLGVAELVPLLLTAFIGGALCIGGVLVCGALLPRFVRYGAARFQGEKVERSA